MDERMIADEELHAIGKDEDILSITVYLTRLQWQRARDRDGLMRIKVENAITSLQRFAQERWPGTMT